MMRQHLQTLARYNLWATQKLLNEHIALLSDADYRKDTGLFFKSIHGTLNHLLVGEHLLLPFVPTLMHVFNHATHHRGQITAALTMLGQNCPELDMVYFLQSEQSI